MEDAFKQTVCQAIPGKENNTGNPRDVGTVVKDRLCSISPSALAGREAIIVNGWKITNPVGG